MNVKQRFITNVEVILLLSISGVLFFDVVVDLSGTLPDGWFHFILGVFLLGSGIVLFITRNRSTTK